MIYLHKDTFHNIVVFYSVRVGISGSISIRICIFTSPFVIINFIDSIIIIVNMSVSFKIIAITTTLASELVFALCLSELA